MTPLLHSANPIFPSGNGVYHADGEIPRHSSTSRRCPSFWQWTGARTTHAKSSTSLNENSCSPFHRVSSVGRLEAGASRRTGGEPIWFERSSLRHLEYSLSDSGGFPVLQLFNMLAKWSSRYASLLAAARDYSQLARSIGFGSRDCESSPQQIKKSTGLALTELSEGDPASEGRASPSLWPTRRVLYLGVDTILRN